jgi:hypothetical protein
MKYIKSFNESMYGTYDKSLVDRFDEKQLRFIGKFLYATKYTVNNDNSIDVHGNIYIFDDQHDIKYLPIKFGKVYGNFLCYNCGLTTLENAPSYVSGDFECYKNKLKNLVGSPNDVDGHFKCYDNNLETLEGMPVEIGKNFVCYGNNELTELDSISNIEGSIICGKSTDISKFRGHYKEIYQVD